MARDFFLGGHVRPASRRRAATSGSWGDGAGRVNACLATAERSGTPVGTATPDPRHRRRVGGRLRSNRGAARQACVGVCSFGRAVARGPAGAWASLPLFCHHLLGVWAGRGDCVAPERPVSMAENSRPTQRGKARLREAGSGQLVEDDRSAVQLLRQPGRPMWAFCLRRGVRGQRVRTTRSSSLFGWHRELWRRHGPVA